MTHPVHRPGHVGARFPKVDGPGKADGSGIYADDIRLPRMLHAKILRSPHANARIRGIDVSAAEAYPGVIATLVGAELPVKYGVIPWTHCPPCLEGKSANGQSSRFSLLKRLYNDASDLVLNPVPTLPAKSRRFFS